MLAALLLSQATAAAPTPKCPPVAFGPARQVTGIWYDGFEDQRFFAGAQTVPHRPWPHNDIWFDAERFHGAPDFRRGGQGHAYRITAVVRDRSDMRRAFPCGYGHLGVSRGETRLVRLLRWSDLGPVDGDRQARRPARCRLTSASRRHR